MRMPRRLRRFPKRWAAAGGELDSELRECLERWIGILGPDESLRTRSDWAEAWARWGDVILPEFVARNPGCRPAAMYAAGLLPRRVLDEPLPASHGFLATLVADAAGGVWHYAAREPFQRCEAAWLLEHGVIDRAEYRRHHSGPVHAWRCTNPDRRYG